MSSQKDVKNAGLVATAPASLNVTVKITGQVKTIFDVYLVMTDSTVEYTKILDLSVQDLPVSSKKEFTMSLLFEVSQLDFVDFCTLIKELQDSYWVECTWQ